jgi:ABC-type multidrug transport system ATPase subunit
MAWVSEIQPAHSVILHELFDVDPGNRRVVWNNLIKAKKEDQAILLTSHSMAECDVLCSRLAIMVNGQFKCLGTPQHLKHRFGTGYYLKLRVEDESSIQIASNIVQQYLTDSVMTVRELVIPRTDRHGLLLSRNDMVLVSNTTFRKPILYRRYSVSLKQIRV